MQRFAARREDPDLGRSLKQRVGQARACAHQVLAVVENEQQLVFTDVGAKRLRDRSAGLFVYAQDLRGDIRNQRRISDWREVDKPDTVRIFLQHVSPDLQGQPCLAEAAHSKQGQQPCAFEQALGIGELAPPPDERRNLLWQVIRRRFERAQRREITAQLRVDELVDVLARRQVA